MTEEKRGWRLGVIASLSILVVVYIALQIFLFQQEEYFVPMGILVLLMFSGIIIKVMFQGPPKTFYTMFQSRFLWSSITLILVGFVVIKVVLLVISFVSGALLLTTIPDLYFAVLAAICETWGINAGVQTLVEYLSGSNWLGVLIGALVAVGLHWRVYGQTGLLLAFVFISFFILNVLYKLSGDREEIPMIVHGLFNVF